MNDMEEKRDYKEIKVRLHHIDSGNCTEVWEVQDAIWDVMTAMARRSGTRYATPPTGIASATAM